MTIRYFFGGLVALGLIAETVLAAPRAERVTPVVRVFKECSPAVVNLSTTAVVTVQPRIGIPDMFHEMFDFPTIRPRSYTTHSVGSGFLIHEDGYLVTNAHVVERAAECKAVFADGTELSAIAVASDPASDLAVLKVDAPKPLPFLKMGKSDDLMPGETVIAIGNPLGYQHTVTSGVISAINRELRFSSDRVYSGLIQTDASINPGNSGGPLLNIFGELIGINSAIRGDAQNIGFAIPVDRLHDLLPSMLDLERLRRVRFGLHFDSDGDHGSVAGVRVKSVDQDSPAAAAGVLPGDIVTAIEGKPTGQFMDAFGILSGAKTGRRLDLEVAREGGKRRKVEVLLAEVPVADNAERMKAHFGLTVRDLTAADLKRIGLRRPVGLLVTDVQRGTSAAEGGVERGDIITMFGGWPVTSLESLGQLIEQVTPRDRIPFQLLRVRGESFTRFELGLRAK
ncbi:MAG TPA: trypsin-like peptidase domain-containing protein [Phycisphaerae bacterium]|nr:trypsin-like peptidase domain-containing protein [Phycisphaerae bacterium]